MSKFKTWYELNGAAYNKLRRKRYRNNENYRENILEQNRDYKKRTRPKAEDPFIKYITIEEGKPLLRVYTLGVLAELFGCTNQAIRNWERDGVIFETPLRDDKDQRLYTDEMVEIIYTVLQLKGKLNNISARCQKPTSCEFLCINDNDKVLEKIRFFFRASFLDTCQRSETTIRELENDEVLPISPYYDPRNGRIVLYTQQMLDIVKDEFNKLRLHNFSVQGRRYIYDRIENRWNSLPKYVLLYPYKD